MKSLIIAAVLISSVAVSAAEVLEPMTVQRVQQTGNLMPTIGTTEGPRITTQLTVNVASGGCTKSSDFVLKIKETKNVQIVSIVRTKPDGCEAYLPNGTDVVLVTGELSQNKGIRIANPLYIIQNFVY